VSQAELSMVVRRVSADASVIDIRGEVNASADNAFTDAYSQASSDITLLIRANRNGQSLIAVGLNEHYQHIFELTRLNEAIRVFETEEEALAGLDS